MPIPRALLTAGVLTAGALAFAGTGFALGAGIGLTQQERIASVLQSTSAVLAGIVGLRLTLSLPSSAAGLAAVRSSRVTERDASRRLGLVAAAWALSVAALALATVLIVEAPSLFNNTGHPDGTERAIVRRACLATLGLFAYVQLVAAGLAFRPMLGLPARGDTRTPGPATP